MMISVIGLKGFTVIRPNGAMSFPSKISMRELSISLFR